MWCRADIHKTAVVWLLQFCLQRLPNCKGFAWEDASHGPWAAQGIGTALLSLNLIKPRFLEIHWRYSMPRDCTGHILKVVAINNPVSESVNGCVSHTINLSSDTTPPDYTSTVLIWRDSLAWLFVQCMFPWLFFSHLCWQFYQKLQNNYPQSF